MFIISSSYTLARFDLMIDEISSGDDATRPRHQGICHFFASIMYGDFDLAFSNLHNESNKVEVLFLFFPPWPSIFSDYSFCVHHHPVSRDDRHLLAHVMAFSDAYDLKVYMHI
jgi:hypothetical protein